MNKWLLLNLIAIAMVGSLAFAQGILPDSANLAQADVSEAPFVKQTWILPDEDLSMPGTQIAPASGVTKQLSCWIAVAGNAGMIGTVPVEIHYPDGSPKHSQTAVEVADPSSAVNTALASGLITPEEANEIAAGTVKIYQATGDLSFSDASGYYRVEAWVTNQEGLPGKHSVNAFECSIVSGIEVDFVNLDFGGMVAGTKKDILGDEDMATPTMPTVLNAGNIPSLVQLLATPMIGEDSGKVITDFHAEFLGQSLDFEGGESVIFGNILLPQTAARFNYAIDIPSEITADKYKGSMTFSVYLPAPQVNVTEPAGGTVCHPGQICPIRWQASGDPRGGGLLIDIWFSPDGGNSWTLQIAQRITNNGTYDWMIPVDAEFVSGEAQIKVIATNNLGVYESDEATLTIINSAPVAADQTVTTDEDMAKAITLTATDMDGDALTYSIVVPPTHGTLTGTAPDMTYTPNADYNGADSFTFKANDGTVDSNVATVSITVNPVDDAPVNNAPVAVDDSATTDEDTAVDIAVLANDSDIDGNTLSVSSFTDPAHGTATINGNMVTYAPYANYNGTDSFEYTVSDGNGGIDTATVSITINAVNDAPVAVNDSYNTNEDTVLDVAALGVLGNDTDVDNASLTTAKVTDPAHGTLSFNADGSFSYTPEANWSGDDSFTYKANDGTADSNIATVSITVNAVNDAPVAGNDAYNTNKDTVLEVTAPGVLGNDTDTESDPLSAILVSGVSNGELTLNADGSFTYTPATGWNGSDSFTYKANDGALDSNEATVSITVNQIN